MVKTYLRLARVESAVDMAPLSATPPSMSMSDIASSRKQIGYVIVNYKIDHARISGEGASWTIFFGSGNVGGMWD